MPLSSAGLAAVTAGVLVAASASAVLYASHVPAVVGATAPADVFSSERALAHVLAISQTPHPAGGEGNRRVREYLAASLATIGLTPETQEAIGLGTRYPVAGRVHNVLTRIRGSASNGKALLLVAHFDGVPASPAAGDNAAAVAALLETLRALRAGPPVRNDIIALFTDAEESGLAGAAAFVRDHAYARDVAVAINFDGRGTHGPSYMFETGDGNLDLVRALRHVPGATGNSLIVTVYRRLPNDTDLSELLRLGVPALNFGFIGGVNRYHTAEDDAGHLDPRSVQHDGNQMLALM